MNATDLSIQQTTTINWNDPRTTGLELHIYSDRSWTDIDGTLHGAGNPQNGIFTQRVSGLSNNTTTHKLTIPAFSLTPTRNAIRGNSVRLYFWVMQVAGTSATPIKQVPGAENGLTIPATLTSESGCSPSPTCADWRDLIVANSPVPSPLRDTYPTFADVTRIINAALGTAQTPGGVGTELQFKNGSVFGAVTSSAVSGPDVTLAGSLTLTIPASESLIAGPSTQRLTLNPYSTDVTGATNTGGAPLLFEPTYHYTGASDFRSVGIGVRTSFGSTTGGEAVFWTPYWFLSGNSSTPIAAGTKGNPSGYEANIFTAQAAADMSEAVHAFGATIVGSGGAPIYGSAISIPTTTTAATIIGHNLDIAKNVSGGTQYAYLASSTGSQPISSGFTTSGAMTYGFDFLGGTFSVAAGRIPNNKPIVGRNAANSGDLTIMLINAADEVEVGNTLVNQQADPILRVGNGSTGWAMQKVDTGGYWRLYSYAAPGERFRLDPSGQAYLTGVTLGGLVNTNGGIAYCSDCQVTSGADNTCAGSGSGALAVRLNGVWRCFAAQN